jgi:hypothetical protein
MPTPLEKLTSDWQAHYSDMPLSDFVTKVHSKMYADIPFADFTDKLGLTVPNEAIKEPSPPAEFNPDMYPMDQGAAQTGAKLARPVLEYGGLAAGAAGGAPAGPAGSVAGAGLGYGAGKGIADLLDEWTGLKAAPSLGQRFVQSGKDVVSGAAMEAGGQALATGLTAAGKAISESGAAERVYASAVKMPLSRKWIKARGPEGTSNVKMAVNKGLSEQVPPSELGLEAAKAGKKNAADAIDAEISKMTGTYSTQEILDTGLVRALEKARKGEAPIKNLDKIIQYSEDLAAGHPPELTPTQLNELKKSLYELANFDKMYGKADSLVETMRKGVAHEARLQLQASNPALKDVNADYASWRLLEEALELSLAKRNNRDLVDLGTKVLVGNDSLPLAVFNQTVGHPRVKAQIAFMLKNANKTASPNAGRAVAYSFDSATGRAKNEE